MRSRRKRDLVETEISFSHTKYRLEEGTRSRQVIQFSPVPKASILASNPIRFIHLTNVFFGGPLYSKGSCKRTQHVGATSPNIVGILLTEGVQTITKCWTMLLV